MLSALLHATGTSGDDRGPYLWLVATLWVVACLAIGAFNSWKWRRDHPIWAVLNVPLTLGVMAYGLVLMYR